MKAILLNVETKMMESGRIITTMILENHDFHDFHDFYPSISDIGKVVNIDNDSFIKQDYMVEMPQKFIDYIEGKTNNKKEQINSMSFIKLEEDEL